MKKLIALFVVAAFLSRAQNNYYPTVSIKKVSPDTVCNGSVLNIMLTYTPCNGSPGSVSTTTITADDGYGHHPIAWSGDQSLFDIQPTVTVNGEKCYIVQYTIPNNFYVSAYPNAQPVMQIGHCLINGTNGGSNTNFVNKNCQFHPDLTGIEEYKSDPALPIYYDLQGNVIEKRYNELIIEQVGYARRKIFITGVQ